MERRGPGFIAISAEPWLEVADPVFIQYAGRFVEITYRASFWDEPARPVFRFETREGEVIETIAAGPVAGAGIWIGRVPRGTIRVTVSPTNRAGPFAFAIEGVRRRAWVALLALGFRQVPRSARSAILTRLIGWGPESDINLAWATGSTKIEHYLAWRRRRERPLDLDGIDAPRFDWASAPPIHVRVLAGGDTRSEDLAATLASLRAQVHARWTALVSSDHAPCLPDDPRIRLASPGPAPEAPDTGLVTVVAAGDRLPPWALACVAETASRVPTARLFYGDEERDLPGGDVHPVFKPGWSPRLFQRAPILGRSVFVRAPLSALTLDERTAFLTRARLPGRWLDGPGIGIAPIRRVLLNVASARAPAPKPVTPLAPKPRPDASAAIIIPTRDQAALLRRAITSLRRFPARGRTEIVIIDNGSVAAETRSLFAEYAGEADLRVLPHPGPFNFSLMCNQAVATTRADVLVFLNNDTEALVEGWLDRLKGWALDPSVGAVGALLTYPDGRVQHSGVLLGMGESAGHFGAFATPDDPGWAGRHAAVHEVAAVTGACLAVAREKFEAVGGFDAVDLPIELSDIDICLKLAGRGWTAIVDPAIRLLHAESASRGTATFRRLDVYARERAVFRQRWRHALRDDPYFHPGLSLFRWREALG